MNTLKHKPFNLAFKATVNNHFEYDKKHITSILLNEVSSIKSKHTAKRRSQTVISWLKWIFSVIDT